MTKPEKPGHRPRLALLVAFGTCFALAAYAVWKVQLDRYGELHAVEDRLRAVAGVALIRTWGNEDVTFEDIGATVEVHGKGPVVFGNLELASFEGRKPFHVGEIGALRVLSCGWGHLGVYKEATGERVKSLAVGSGFTVGSGGEFTSLFPFPVQTPVDVIKHYDDINEVLSTWPRAPAFRELRTKEGDIVVRYAVTDDRTVSLESSCNDLQGT